MDRIVEWAKSHPYLLGGVVLAIVILWVLYSNASSAAASTATASTAAAATSGPDDTIQAAEIAAGTTVAQAQLSANASVAQDNAAINAAALNDQVTNAQTAAAVQVNNQNTQASLTLGLANGGQSTQSILELLGGQPGASPITQQLIVSGIPTSVPTSTTPATNSTTATIPTPVTNPQPVTLLGQSQTSVSSPSTSAEPVDPGSLGSNIDETGVMETVIGGPSMPLNPQYYATPAAASELATILGTSTGTYASQVGVAGGPFSTPAAEGIVVSQGGNPSGIANAGQVLAGLQNTAPGTWAQQLAGYGITLSSSEENQLYTAFGPNQAVPDDTADTSIAA